MANKTAARSSARTTRSKGATRSAKPAPRRKPAKKRTSSPVATAAATGGRAARATWLMLAKGRARPPDRSVEPATSSPDIAVTASRWGCWLSRS
ncbi:hypothetical protein ACQ856_25120 [Mycolicibacterium psychrotolerans]|uniref:hypothetical protein n=1 Tax=Mycolicibacterium psychrotolerans TaxID=216929 RepID=UPI003D668ECC